jgi:non-ribosomal peptide synthetase component F
VVGTPIANRTRAETEGLIGFFANTLALPADLAGAPTFRELLAQVRETALGAYAHQDLPFEKLVEALQPARELNRQPIFQTMFVLQNTPPSGGSLPGLEVTPLRQSTTTAKFDLTLAVNETPEGLKGSIEYATDLFGSDSIERISKHLLNALAEIARDPDQAVNRIPLIGGDERRLLLEDWNRTGTVWPDDGHVHEIVERQARLTPEAPAVVSADGSLSFAELDREANRLAHRLIALGAGADVLVGLCVERSPRMIVALLAILKAGAAYLPLDPTYPAERLAFMAEDAKAPIILVTAQSADRLAPAAGTTLLRIDGDDAQVGPDTSPGPKES